MPPARTRRHPATSSDHLRHKVGDDWIIDRTVRTTCSIRVRSARPAGSPTGAPAVTAATSFPTPSPGGRSRKIPRKRSGPSTPKRSTTAAPALPEPANPPRRPYPQHQNRADPSANRRTGRRSILIGPARAAAARRAETSTRNRDRAKTALGESDTATARRRRDHRRHPRKCPTGSRSFARTPGTGSWSSPPCWQPPTIPAA
jgi:hypothetical protein